MRRLEARLKCPTAAYCLHSTRCQRPEHEKAPKFRPRSLLVHRQSLEDVEEHRLDTRKQTYSATTNGGRRDIAARQLWARRGRRSHVSESLRLHLLRSISRTIKSGIRSYCLAFSLFRAEWPFRLENSAILHPARRQEYKLAPSPLPKSIHSSPPASVARRSLAAYIAL